MSASPEEGGGQTPHCVFRADCHTPKAGQNRFTLQRFSMTEAYLEGRLRLSFPIASLFGRSDLHDEIAHRLEAHGGRANAPNLIFPNQNAEIPQAQFHGQSSDQNEMVLVAFVESFDGVEILVPARIGAEFVNCLDDLFRGEMHLSGGDGTFKTLLRGTEGEANGSSVFCLVANHSETKVVEGSAEVVNGIPDGQSNFIGDGWIGLDVNQSIRGIFALPNSQFERAAREIFGDLPVKLGDVLFGPLDFL